MNRTTSLLAAAAVPLLLVLGGCAAEDPEPDPGAQETPKVTVPLTGPTKAQTTPPADASKAPEAEPSPEPGDPVAETYPVALPVPLETLETAAGDAAEFAQRYASYDFRADPAERMRLLERALAKAHQVHLEDAVPSGPLAETLVSERTITTVTVKDVALEMVARDTIVFAVDADVDTSLGAGTPQARSLGAEAQRFVLSMAREQTNRWRVQSIATGDDHAH